MTVPTAYLLASAATLATRQADARLRPYEITLRQLGLLIQVRAEPELTASELARQLGVSRQSVHQLVEELVAAGHLERRPGASGRSRRLEPTETAGYLVRRAGEVLDGVDDEVVGGLSAAEVEVLRGLLRRLLAHGTDDESWLDE
ncbi:MarR family winged helix-turn-helix transcriptional regulator [Actinokineospora pegani]|uniref:MarR family winged helix-turn-helix transcriptional regulator n=1 Tax=Actinokineospora pegani TaxID=2654637 RepID=UPI0012EA79D4|nr:MarR family transcriptional regulator [Actinokineospora pegani]